MAFPVRPARRRSPSAARRSYGSLPALIGVGVEDTASGRDAAVLGSLIARATGAELMLIGAVGERMVALLRGDADTQQLLTTENAGSAADHLYDSAPATRIYNHIARNALAELIRERAPDRRISAAAPEGRGRALSGLPRPQ